MKTFILNFLLVILLLVVIEMSVCDGVLNTESLLLLPTWKIRLFQHRWSYCSPKYWYVHYSKNSVILLSCFIIRLIEVETWMSVWVRHYTIFHALHFCNDIQCAVHINLLILLWFVSCIMRWEWSDVMGKEKNCTRLSLRNLSDPADALMFIDEVCFNVKQQRS